MAEAFDVQALPDAKPVRYAALGEQIAAVLAGETNLVARMATVAAMLAAGFDHFLWTGFYVVDPDRPQELVIGPYQGALGCLRIAFGRGVCGAAAARRETVVVPNVDEFPGHIACDSRSRSEIVAPVFDGDGRLIGVLDVDCAELDGFDDDDARGLETVLQLAFSSRVAGAAR